MRLAALAAGWTHDLVMTIGPAADGIFSSNPFSSRPFSSRRRLHRYLAARDADGAAAEIGHHLTGLCFMPPRAQCLLFLAKWDIIPANLAQAVLRIPMNVALLPDKMNGVATQYRESHRVMRGHPGCELWGVGTKRVKMSIQVSEE